MKIKSTVIDFLYILLGNLIVAISISCFTAPNEIAAGGFTGIATIFYSLFSFPIGNTILLLNIPVFIIGANKFGLKFLYKTIIATMLMTVLIDVASVVLPKYQGEKILACVFGGGLLGLGLALIFTRGATTGGVDIIAKLITAKFPQFSIGTLILFLDAGVVIASAIVYKNIENALFAVVSIFVQTKIIDTIIYGANKGRVILIKSEYCDEIMEKMYEYLGRLPTFIDNSVEKRNVILCAAHRYEAVKLHNIVKEIDNSAFIVSLEAGEIFGEGFAKLNESA